MSPQQFREMDRIFQAAIDLPAEERAAFVAEQCGADQELRQQVEDLLACDMDATRQLDRAVQQAGEQMNADAEQALAKSRIGPYQLEREIGQGGMGAVYEAFRSDGEYRQQVAIKLIRVGMATDFVLKRFRAERQILARLQHPNIARLLDGGTTETKQPYFVMEYIEGESITAYCDRKRLDTRDKLELFLKVCDAVSYAHGNLVIHRDLKPGNILVTNEGIPKLLDFGIAKLLSDEVESDAPPETLTGIQLLTPDYASPEQVRGDPISIASDVYSLGAILYELLVGTRPYKVPSRQSPLDLIRIVCETEPVKPSLAVQSGKLRRELDGDLDNIVLMAMRKEPERRYSSADHFSEDIRRYLTHLPVSARKETLAYQSSKFLRRHRAGVAAAALVAVSLVGGTLFSVYQAQRAERRFAQVRKLANTFLFTFHDRIEALPGSTEAREMVVKTALEYLNSLAQEAGNDTGLLSELASAYIKVGDVQGDPRRPNLGHQKEAIASYEKARDLADRLLAANPGQAAALRVASSVHTKIGDLSALSGDQARAKQELQLGMAQAEQLLALPDAAEGDFPIYVSSMNRLGDKVIDTDLDAAQRYYEKGLAAANRMRERWPSNTSNHIVAQSYGRLGRLAHERGDPETCARQYRSAQQLVAELVRKQPNNALYRRDLINFTLWLGNISGSPGYFHLGDPGAAVRYYNTALEIRRERPADPKDMQAKLDLAIHHSKLAEVLVTMKPAEAARAAKECVTILDGLLESNPKQFLYRRVHGNCVESLGSAQLAEGNAAAAVTTLKQRLAALEVFAQGQEDDLGVRESLVNAHLRLGRALEGAKRTADADQQYRDSLARVEKLRKEYPKDLFFLRDAAEVYETMGRFVSQQPGKHEEALAWYEKAAACWQEWPKIGRASTYDRLGRERVQQLIASTSARRP